MGNRRIWSKLVIITVSIAQSDTRFQWANFKKFTVGANVGSYPVF